MTESEWMMCADPYPMLMFLRGQASERKLRLFAVACCQRLLRKVQLHPWYSYGLAVTADFADGQATLEELERVRYPPTSDWCLQHTSWWDRDEIILTGQFNRINSLAIWACGNAKEVEDAVVMADCASLNAAWAMTQPGSVMPDDNGVSAGRLAAEQAVQADSLREVVGIPFRPVIFSSDLLTPTVVSLAHAAYDNRELPTGHIDPIRLAVLADALEEEGCIDAEILGHLRGPGPHARGCWLIDLLSGRS